MSLYPDSPSYPTPDYSAFGNTIGNLANTFRSGQQQNQQRDISTAFQNGIPTDANGNPDYNKIMQILAQKGDINAISSLSGPALDQSQLKQAQTMSPLLGGVPVAGAPTGGPTAPTGEVLGPAASVTSAPLAPPSQAAAPVVNVPAPGGAQLGDLSGAASAFPTVQALVSSAVPDPAKASAVATNLAKALKVDPSAPMTRDQAAQGQRILAAYVQRNGGGGATLGARNNNPDNIENGPYAAGQPGYAGAGEGGRFAKFDTPEAGLDAAANLLGVYGRKGINTIAGIASTWAPAKEKGNDPTAYAETVSKALGVDPNQPLDLSNADARRAIATAMSRVESPGAVQAVPGGGDLPPASAAAGIPTRRPPSNQVADNSQQPLVPQVPLPQGFTDPQQAILAIDREMARLSTNPRNAGQVAALKDYRDRIAESTAPMKVGPSDTYVDPRTGKTVYQGPWAGSGGMLNGPALDQAAEAYYQTGKPPPNLGRGIQGAAGLNSVITRAAELHPDDPVENWPERQAKFKAEKGFTGQVDDLAAGIKKGDQPPTLTGLYGLSGPIRQKLEKDGFDLAGAQLQWQRAQKQIASLNGPQQVRFVGLANSVVNTIDEVRDLSEQMGNSGVPLLNKAKMEAYAQANGNSDKGQLTARYIAAVNTLKEEFANLANGGYAPTEAAWALANGQINGDFGVKQLGASLDEVQRLINYRLKAMPGLSTNGPGAPNAYLPQQGGANPGAAPPPQPGAPAGAVPQPDKDGWVTLPGGIRIREAQ
jgi:hypothetical protein